MLQKAGGGVSAEEKARAYREDGRYLLALSCAQSGEGAGCLAERAQALCWLARYDEAEQAARRGLEQSRSGAERCQSLTALSMAACGLAEYREGIDLAEQAIQIGAEGPGIGPALAKSAACASQGLYGEARLSAHAALSAAQRMRNRDRADAMHALADVEHRAGEYAQAAALWQLAMSMRRSCLREGHPETGCTADGFAHSLRRLGQPDMAIRLHREALGIYAGSLDPGHPAISSSRHGLAQSLHRTGRHEEARAQLEKATESAAVRLGEDHPDTWTSRFELGRIELHCGDPQRGMLRMETARLRVAKLLGENHPTVKAMDRWRQGAARP
jgi:tetratricopeptide (TPR) repeat protein